MSSLPGKIIGVAVTSLILGIFYVCNFILQIIFRSILVPAANEKFAKFGMAGFASAWFLPPFFPVGILVGVLGFCLFLSSIFLFRKKVWSRTFATFSLILFLITALVTSFYNSFLDLIVAAIITTILMLLLHNKSAKEYFAFLKTQKN